MLDPSNYAASVKMPQHLYVLEYGTAEFGWNEYLEWAAVNGIEISFSHGWVYFKTEEDAVAFKLKFGL